jgi:hypothetical protein
MESNAWPIANFGWLIHGYPGFTPSCSARKSSATFAAPWRASWKFCLNWHSTDSMVKLPQAPVMWYLRLVSAKDQPGEDINGDCSKFKAILHVLSRNWNMRPRIPQSICFLMIYGDEHPNISQHNDISWIGQNYLATKSCQIASTFCVVSTLLAGF